MASFQRVHVRGRARGILVAVALIAASVGVTAAPANAGAQDFYSIVDTDGDTISGFDASGTVASPGAPSLRFWGGVSSTDLRECTSWQTDTLVTWCTSPFDVFTTVTISDDRSCLYDETYPLVDGSACFLHQFSPGHFGAGTVYWLRGQASATGVDGSGNTFRFEHWSISGATNSEGTCQEGSTSAACTVSFVPNSGQIHMTAVYELVPPPGDALVFSGFAQPIDADALNVAKAGRTIPLKWRVTDENDLAVSDLTAVSVRVTSLTCALGDTSDQVEEYASGQSGLQNLGDGYYQYNWAAPKAYASSCKTLHLDLGDGIDHTADFQFVK